MTKRLISACTVRLLFEREQLAGKWVHREGPKWLSRTWSSSADSGATEARDKRLGRKRSRLQLTDHGPMPRHDEERKRESHYTEDARDALTGS